MFEIRSAEASDVSAIVDFNCRLAEETEQFVLDREIVTRGVAAALADPRKARYFVACDGDRPIGQLMHTWEWSDWRDGVFWWLQSVYVVDEYRGRGVFRQLFEHVRALAEMDPRVVGLRLYVEQENDRAHAVYEKLGLTAPGYRVMEQRLR